MKHLAQKLSIYHNISDVSNNFASRIKALREEIGVNAEVELKEHAEEIFKAYVLILIQKIPIDLSREFNLELEDKPNSYIKSIDLIDDLSLLHDELERCGIGEVAHVDVGWTKRILKIFGSI